MPYAVPICSLLPEERPAEKEGRVPAQSFFQRGSEDVCDPTLSGDLSLPLESRYVRLPSMLLSDGARTRPPPAS